MKRNALVGTPGSCRVPASSMSAAILAVMLGLSFSVSAEVNPLVDPVLNPGGSGNPSCQSVGFDFGFKPQFQNNDADWSGGFPGTFAIPGGEIEILHARDFPSSNSHLGFRSTVAVAGFIVKGGPNAYLYNYAGNGLDQVPFDTNLTVPDHPVVGAKPDISHVEVCLNYRLSVTKTAVASFDRTYEWEIGKSVLPEAAQAFFGDSQTFDYTIDVSYTGFEDDNFEVSGTITVSNPFPGVNATNLVVADMLDDGTMASVDCGVVDSVAGGASVQCSYMASPMNAGATLNTATATYTMAGGSRTSSGTAEVNWTRNDIDGTVTIEDRFDGGPVVELGSCSFDDEAPCRFSGELTRRTLDCSDFGISESGGSDSKSNIAAIVETGASDSAMIELTCWAPSVAKTATPSFSREYFWTVVKALEGDDPPLLSEGQSYELAYTIDVDLDEPAFTDYGYEVSGTITVVNPAPIVAVIMNLSDDFTGGSEIMLDCGGDAPYAIAAKDSLVCTYSGDSNGSNGSNTATAVQQNYARSAMGAETPAGTTTYAATVDFAFVNPTGLIHDCVDVYDLLSVEGVEIDMALLLQAGFDPDEASVCFEEELPVRLTYRFEEAWFEPGDAMAEPPICELLVDNTAVVVDFNREAVDPDLLASSSVQTTLLNANCTPEGCTLTQGYWKTHSAYGPAPHDVNWGNVGEDTPFFLSGQSWYAVFWTPPAGGNVYYRLAHQYMAAALNEFNGASVPGHVAVALDDAAELFGRCGPADFARTRPGRFGSPGGPCEADAGRASELAGLLDSYNNGYEGVLHCSDVGYDD